MLIITEATINAFASFLAEREYAAATISKYAHDVCLLMDYAPDGIPDRAAIVGFRVYLEAKSYSPASVNSILGAVNVFLTFLGSDWRLKYLRVQRKAFLPADKELSHKEYERMVRTAENGGNKRLALLVQTLCALGLRVSELRAVTVESLERGEATIQNKGKLRTILIPHALAKKLADYCAERGIVSGSVFVTRTGKPLDRSNIWKMLKSWRRRRRCSRRRFFPTICATCSPGRTTPSSRTLCGLRTFSDTAASKRHASILPAAAKKKGGSSDSSDMGASP